MNASWDKITAVSMLTAQILMEVLSVLAGKVGNSSKLRTS